MTDIVERLRTGFDWDWDCVEPNLGALIQYGDLTDEAADELEKLHDLLGKANALARIRWGEIKRLKAELAAETQRRWDGNRIASNEAAADFNELRDIAVKEMARWAREAGASQAREAKLREALVKCSVQLGNLGYSANHADRALALPTDNLALQQAIKQGQREVLLEAADIFDKSEYLEQCGGFNFSRDLRRMAEEIK